MSAWQGGDALAAEARDELRRDCIGRVDTAIKTLETLTGPLLGSKDAPYGQTSERLALIASAYKRMAMMQSGKKRLQALDRMKRFYRESAALAETRQADVAYPLLNAVAAALAESWQNRTELTDAERLALSAAVADDLARARRSLAQQLERAPAYRLYAMSVDAHLLEVLASGTLDDAAIDSIVADYLDYRAAGSVRQVDSVFAQFDFLRTMARTVQLRDRLDSLRQRRRQGARPGDPRPGATAGRRQHTTRADTQEGFMATFKLVDQLNAPSISTETPSASGLAKSCPRTGSRADGAPAGGGALAQPLADAPTSPVAAELSSRKAPAVAGAGPLTLDVGARVGVGVSQGGGCSSGRRPARRGYHRQWHRLRVAGDLRTAGGNG